MRTSEITTSYVITAENMLANIKDYSVYDVYDFINDIDEQIKSFRDDVLAITEKLIELEEKQIESEMLTDDKYGYLYEISCCNKAIESIKKGIRTLHRKRIEICLASKEIW